MPKLNAKSKDAKVKKITLDVGNANYKGEDGRAGSGRKVTLTMFDDSLIFKKDSRVERINDLAHMPSQINSLQ